MNSLKTVNKTDLYLELKKNFGFNSFKGRQEEIILNLLEEKDSIVIMPTGGGKSMCYQLPALISSGTAIVISPLIALMKNQVDLLRGFSKSDNIAHVLNSSLSKTETETVKRDLYSKKTKLLYVAPESLIKDSIIDLLKKIEISFYAIDEAHCISEWGHDFRPEYRKLRQIFEKIKIAPIIALTATATPKVRNAVTDSLVPVIRAMMQQKGYSDFGVKNLTEFFTSYFINATGASAYAAHKALVPEAEPKAKAEPSYMTSYDGFRAARTPFLLVRRSHAPPCVLSGTARRPSLAVCACV